MHDSFEPFSLIVLFECTSLVKRLRLVLHETPLPHVTILNLGWLEQGTTTSYSSHLKRHERKTASSLWLNQIRISLIFESILIKYCFLSSTTVIWLNHLPFYPIRLILQTNNSQSCTILLLLAAFCIFICFSVNYSMYVVYFFLFFFFLFLYDFVVTISKLCFSSRSSPGREKTPDHWSHIGPRFTTAPAANSRKGRLDNDFFICNIYQKTFQERRIMLFCLNEMFTWKWWGWNWIHFILKDYVHMLYLFDWNI